MNIVGRAAAPAGLCDDESRVVQIVFSGIQRVQKLTDDQQRRIAGVVVDVFQSVFRHLRTAVAQKLTGIALILHGGGQNSELNGSHAGNQYLMGLFHFRGKFRIIHLHGSALLPRGAPPSVFLFLQCGKQAPQADAHRAQICNFVYF
ncbi:hypothetical protein SDC9_133739 [bioreactor metagenome]|uniref:Uncharacterized protein n=1 Tax=bioreactor metagenome TaxID=1076179 RepID=A0A645DBQ4_9ZZZZ